MSNAATARFIAPPYSPATRSRSTGASARADPRRDQPGSETPGRPHVSTAAQAARKAACAARAGRSRGAGQHIEPWRLSSGVLLLLDRGAAVRRGDHLSGPL